MMEIIINCSPVSVWGVSDDVNVKDPPTTVLMDSVPSSGAGQMLVLTHLAVFVGGKLVGGHIPLHLVGVSVQWSHQGQEGGRPVRNNLWSSI